MIPTTFSGIALLLVSLLPGFVYVSCRDRHRPTRKLSAFRETTVVLSVSAVGYAVPLIVVIISASIWPSFRNELLRFLQGPTLYSVASPLEFWGAVAIGVALAVITTAAAGLRRRGSRGGYDPHASAWWRVFAEEGNTKGTVRRVSVYLNDGGLVVGNLNSFSREAEEHSDRELVLQEPLLIQAPNGTKFHEMSGTAVVVSARSIQMLEVEYLVVDQDAKSAPEPEATTETPADKPLERG